MRTISLRLDDESAAFLESKSNSSEYIRELLKKEKDKELKKMRLMIEELKLNAELTQDDIDKILDLIKKQKGI